MRITQPATLTGIKKMTGSMKYLAILVLATGCTFTSIDGAQMELVPKRSVADDAMLFYAGCYAGQQYQQIDQAGWIYDVRTARDTCWAITEAMIETEVME